MKVGEKPTSAGLPSGGRCGWSTNLSSAESFDTVAHTWTSLPAVVHESLFAEAAVIKDHVYLVGSHERETSAERLLPLEHWQELPEMHHGTFGFETAVVDDRLYVCGGYGSTTVELINDSQGGRGRRAEQ